MEESHAHCLLPGQMERARHIQTLQWLSECVVEKLPPELGGQRVVRRGVASRKVSIVKEEWNFVRQTGSEFPVSTNRIQKLVGTYASRSSVHGSILFPVTLEDLQPIPSLQDLVLRRMYVGAFLPETVWIFDGDCFMEQECFRMLFEYHAGKLTLMFQTEGVAIRSDADPNALVKTMPFELSRYPTWKEAFVAATRTIFNYAELFGLSEVKIRLDRGGYLAPTCACFYRIEL